MLKSSFLLLAPKTIEDLPLSSCTILDRLKVTFSNSDLNFLIHTKIYVRYQNKQPLTFQCFITYVLYTFHISYRPVTYGLHVLVV